MDEKKSLKFCIFIIIIRYRYGQARFKKGINLFATSHQAPLSFV
jgi:hypothetical protein